ncbi:MAG: rhodanese-related sulfurtransferase [Candidatus Kapabacteria bacterium]|nr:rhodanese-related sulfurtransferase [Candidatus Kapabacteria bacterium]
MATYNALLYYKFVGIDDTAAVAENQRTLCLQLNLRGRILVASEGINGTLSGTDEACRRYTEAMYADVRFSDMVFKTDEVDGHVFDDLSVKVKTELVTFRCDRPGDPASHTGQRLSPEQWLNFMERGDAIIIDGRTGYEYDVGHFRGAIRPPVDSFRDFPQWIRETFAEDKHRPILTYCTGGIRCEKLTSFLLEEGFSDVYQLDGGIVTYGKDPVTKGAKWDGTCYVFDQRLTVPINHTDDRRVVGACHHCGEPTERYVNCANIDCHRQHLTCSACEATFKRSCSPACMEAPRREPI